MTQRNALVLHEHNAAMMGHLQRARSHNIHNLLHLSFSFPAQQRLSKLPRKRLVSLCQKVALTVLEQQPASTSAAGRV